LHQHRWLEMPESFKELLGSLSGKNRQELRRHEKKLATDYSGRTHIHCHRNEEEVNELAREVEKISVKTYQRALGVGFQPDLETVELLRIAVRDQALRGAYSIWMKRPALSSVEDNIETHSNLHGI